MGEPARTSAAGGVIGWIGDKISNTFTRAADPVKAAEARADFCANTGAKIDAGQSISNTDYKKYDAQCTAGKPNAPGG